MEKGLRMADYPPIFPIIEKSKSDPEYKLRFLNQEKRFQDFAPFLILACGWTWFFGLFFLWFS